MNLNLMVAFLDAGAVRGDYDIVDLDEKDDVCDSDNNSVDSTDSSDSQGYQEWWNVLTNFVSAKLKNVMGARSTLALNTIQNSYPEFLQSYSVEESELPVTDDGVEGRHEALQKRDRAIREIVESEKEYLHNLSLIVDGYIAHMRNPDREIEMPKGLKTGRAKFVFRNAENIYYWHRDVFMNVLKQCLNHPEQLGPLFIKYRRHLYMHVTFCINKRFSDYILWEYGAYFEVLWRELGLEQKLSDLLLKPEERICKYARLLVEVCKCSERAGLTEEVETLKEARHIIEVLLQTASDIEVVSRIVGFDGNLEKQGQFLLHGTLACCETLPSDEIFKGKELQVFLFEHVLIFSQIKGKRYHRYKYINHMQVNTMSLEERVETKEDKNSVGVELFRVRDVYSRKPEFTYVCQASTAELRAEWILSIRKLLQMRRDFVKAIQSPVKHQSELNRDPWTSAVKLEKEGWVVLKPPQREPRDNTQDQTNAVEEGVSQNQNGEEAEEEYILLPLETFVDDTLE